MWADTLLRAEQQHLLRLLLLAGCSIVAGTLVAVLLAVRRERSVLLKHFAIQMVGWGVLVALFAGISWHSVHIRDVSGEARLERFVWLCAGFDVGLVLVGATLAAAGHTLARSAAALGAGAAVIVQGLALFLIDLHFAALISR